MALNFEQQLTFLVAQFEARVASRTWLAVADILSKPPRKRKPPPLEATRENVKRAVFQDRLNTLNGQESGWWTRDGMKYYRCTGKASEDSYYFRLFNDHNNLNPLVVKLSTLLNRWKFKTNNELQQEIQHDF